MMRRAIFEEYFTEKDRPLIISHDTNICINWLRDHQLLPNLKNCNNPICNGNLMDLINDATRIDGQR